MLCLLQLVVKTCHKRGAFAMGGMSAVIPIKGDEAANNVSAWGLQTGVLALVGLWAG